jgi:hypothetical protein
MPTPTDLQITQWLPIVAAALFGLVTGAALFGVTRVASAASARRDAPAAVPAGALAPHRSWFWLGPGLLSVVFMLFSLAAVLHEGPLGFWTEHVRNLWGNQIWFDLLLAIGTAWFLVLPQAKARGMRPGPWLLLIICTGSIGLLAMVARLLYLRDRARL